MAWVSLIGGVSIMRNRMIEDCFLFSLLKYLDMDWEYPSFRGGKPRDRENYAQFVQELREEFELESSKTGRSRY